ncbi:hypothetical protein [Brevibacillus daliensis]|uniref:hypothetical protein n=1 Tax=Brevibacillus daliensis TaxID=2892995 RepID=UPI001E50D5C7|nr:hypothetical protein [Brevibacillus daliensis]
MRFKLLLLLLLLFIFVFLLGCQQENIKSQNIETIIQNKNIPNKESEATKDKEVESVTVLESPENISSPSGSYNTSVRSHI